MLPSNIRFSNDPRRSIIDFLDEKDYSSIAVLTDNNTHQLCHPLIEKGLPPHTVIQVPAGEAYKNLETCTRIWNAMTAQYLDRRAVLLILGGGVLGDMGGFCAATYKRGIDFAIIPTTLLAMADASVGGKLGIDFNLFKNHLGVFCEPALTLIHTAFLQTLPEAELRSGFAEIIKHALLSDAGLFREISSKKLKDQNWDRLVQHSVEFKHQITAADPHEAGRRKILNAGHTVGHAIETFRLKSNKPVLHGEAVAAGLVAEGFIARQKGMLSQSELDALTGYLKEVYGKINLPEEAFDEIGRLCLQDKKNRNGKILCVLLKRFGDPMWDCEISAGEIRQALEFYAKC